MPYKDPIIRAAKNKTYNLTWYEENKERHKANAKDTRRRNREAWNEYTKEAEVSRLAGVGSYKRAYAEVEKCIPLCSNCHRILHWDEGRA